MQVVMNSMRSPSAIKALLRRIGLPGSVGNRNSTHLGGSAQSQSVFEEEPAHVIILGAAQYDGRPSRVLVSRLDHALTFFRSNHKTQFYPVGGNLPGDRFTEAQVSATYLQEHGVTAQNIHPVPTGSDTVGSLEAVLQAHPDLPRTVIVVTDPTHRLRTWLIARRLGLKAHVSPTKTSPTRFPKPSWFRSVAHEGGGVLVFLISLLSPKAADATRNLLHHVEAWIRPSRKARHEEIRKQRRGY